MKISIIVTMIKDVLTRELIGPGAYPVVKADMIKKHPRVLKMLPTEPRSQSLRLNSSG